MPEAVSTARRARSARQLLPRGVRLGERQDLGKIDLRGDAHDRAFMAAVGRVLDLLLPTEPCTSAAKAQIGRALARSGRMALTCPAERRGRSRRRAARGAGRASMPRSPTSRTAGSRSVSPARARATCWPRACPLDLHPRAFPRRQLRRQPARQGRGADPPPGRRPRSAARASTSTSPARSPTISGRGWRTPAANTASRSSRSPDHAQRTPPFSRAAAGRSLAAYGSPTGPRLRTRRSVQAREADAGRRQSSRPLAIPSRPGRAASPSFTSTRLRGSSAQHPDAGGRSALRVPFPLGRVAGAPGGGA